MLLTHLLFDSFLSEMSSFHIKEFLLNFGLFLSNGGLYSKLNEIGNLVFYYILASTLNMWSLTEIFCQFLSLFYGLFVLVFL